MNKNVIETLQKLVVELKSDPNENKYRIRSLENAIKVIKTIPEPLSSGDEARVYKGIGEGIAKKIDEILTTGTLARLTIGTVDTTKILKELCNVTGIGPVKAQELVDLGVTGVSDLRTKVKNGEIELTHHQTIGLKYYEDFLKKIPRDEITQIKQLLKSWITAKFEICGSYRRGLNESGDIDVLVVNTESLQRIVSNLKLANFVVDDITSAGNTKYMGVCRLNPFTPMRRIDIRVVAEKSWGAALMYFTGPKAFNQSMRETAKSKGMKLNEYGIFRIESATQIPVESEQNIFKLLGLPEIKPQNRC